MAQPLAHHGVKGQKWGVTHKDPPALNETDKAILKQVDPNGDQSDRMKAMFGPGSNKEPAPKDAEEPASERRHLTEGQKHALKVGAKVAVAGIAVYGLYRLGKVANEKALGIREADPQFKKFMGTMNKTKLRANRGFSKEFVNNLSDEPVHIPVGGIIKRISTEAETTVRPGGFYAAHKAEDVERYKAVLPVFWKTWGLKAKEGHIVNLKAVEEVRAPSPKKTFEMFSQFVGGDAQARKLLPSRALNWNDSNHPDTKDFFKRLTDAGYNAVPDINDLGSIGDTPLRVIKGDAFVVDSVEKLSLEAIHFAQNNILAIKHFIAEFFSNRRNKLKEGDKQWM